MSKPSAAAVLAWARLVRARDVAMDAVQTALKRAGLPPLEWYDVLLEVENMGSVRPRDLQVKLLLAQYNLSRLLDRMVEAGLINRARCEEDGRGHVLRISDEGYVMRRRMWPVYAGAIQKAVGERLSETDAQRLAELLGPIATRDVP
jgi:DNA-binding MarR family transcriptional regulator